MTRPPVPPAPPPDGYARRSDLAKLLGRMSAKQAAIAIANKTARTAWAIMVNGGVYEAGYRAPNIERRRARLPDKAWRWGDRRSGGARLQRRSERNTP